MEERPIWAFDPRRTRERGRGGTRDPGGRTTGPAPFPSFPHISIHLFPFLMSICIHPTINHIFSDIYHMNTSVSGTKGPSKGVEYTCFTTQGMSRDVVTLCHMIGAILSCCVLEYCCLHIFQRALLPIYIQNNTKTKTMRISNSQSNNGKT